MVSEETDDTNKKSIPIFKNPNFQQKFRPISNSGKKRIWKSLKQILAQERALPWPLDAVHCKFILSKINVYTLIFKFIFFYCYICLQFQIAL